MTSTSQYALMAGVAYESSRSPNNKFPIPDGWAIAPGTVTGQLPSGFEAVTFKNNTTGEIVISFAGTNDPADWATNFSLATGFNAQQLKEAAAYYLTVLTTVANSNPNAWITFTGHSLGGGLAALMSVFFDKGAVTFDQAPFANAATTTVRDDLVAYLTTRGYASPQLNALAPGLATFTGLGQRAGNVSGFAIAGEILSLKIVEHLLGRIGVQTSLAHGSYPAPGDLHAQALLSAFQLNDGFRQATFKLTNLLAMVFDKSLFARDTNKSAPNFLENLLRHQVGVRDPVSNAVTLPADAMLDRFTADLLVLANTPGLGGSSDLAKALIAFAMQAYYEGPNAADSAKQLFTAEGGGLHFLRSDVAGSLEDMKGYADFQNWLANLDTTTWNAIQPKLDNLLDWYLAGRSLDATATDQAALMIGAGRADILGGGGQADVLASMAGNDRLSGNGGNDLLLGGVGNDLYFYKVGDGHDTLIDPDAASARILASSADGNTTYNATTFIQDKDNPKLWKNPDGKITLAQGDTWQLQLSGGGLNLGETFTDGDYGIRRQNAPTSINPTNTIMGTKEGNALSGTSAGDLIDGQDGKDDISGADGNDTIYAGGGIDWVLAGAGDDRVDGGQGDNVLLGSAGQTFSIYYSCHIDLA